MSVTLEPPEIAEMVDRYTRGQGIAFIAYAMSRDRKLVRQALVDAGVKIRTTKPPGASPWGWSGHR